MGGYEKYMDVYVLTDNGKVIGVYKDREDAKTYAEGKSSNLSSEYEIQPKTLM